MNDTNAHLPLHFEPLTLSLKAQVEQIRKSSGNTQYVYTFASLFAWQTDEKYTICLRDDAFLVKNGAEGEHAYLFPCGSDAGKKALIDALIQQEAPVFYTVSDADKRFLEQHYPHRFSFAENRNEFPYLFDRAEHIALSGNAYKRLRHRIHRGRDAVKEWTSQPLTQENADRAVEINRRWLEVRDFSAHADTFAANTALEHFSALSMWGLLFQADGEDAAYVAGTFVTPEIFDISFCKVLLPECTCYIKWALYCALPDTVKTVNSEEDLGLAGLREHKMLRLPKELTRIWKGSYIYE